MLVLVVLATVVVLMLVSVLVVLVLVQAVLTLVLGPVSVLKAGLILGVSLLVGVGGVVSAVVVGVVLLVLVVSAAVAEAAVGVSGGGAGGGGAVEGGRSVGLLARPSTRQIWKPEKGVVLWGPALRREQPGIQLFGVGLFTAWRLAGFS